MKLNILFVDDETNVIRGLKRMLRVLKENWEFFFAESGDAALEIMSKTKINVIVSDMRMPKMNGAQLLEIVKEKYPSTIRMILSGQSNEALALESTRAAHQFISKPIEPEILKQAIRKSFDLYQFLSNDNLRKVINGINELPTLPNTYLKIEKELSSENFSLKNIIAIVKSDIVLTAKILQVVNSAFFGLPQEISDVSKAINLLGSDIIKSLILYVQVFNSYKGEDNSKILLNDIWNHSLIVAKNSKTIISKFGNKGIDIESAYISGLLHDIGKVIILNNDSYRDKILKEMERNNSNYNIAEVEILGTTHSEVGGYLLSLWGLPENVVETVLNHHNAISISNNNIGLLEAVHLANLLADSPKLDKKFIEENNLKNILSDIIELCYN